MNKKMWRRKGTELECVEVVETAKTWRVPWEDYRGRTHHEVVSRDCFYADRFYDTYDEAAKIMIRHAEANVAEAKGTLQRREEWLTEARQWLDKNRPEEA